MLMLLRLFQTKGAGNIEYVDIKNKGMDKSGELNFKMPQYQLLRTKKYLNTSCLTYLNLT